MNRSGEGGFTLVEVVVSAVIMTLMVAAVGNLFISNINTVALGKARAVGLALANEKMEDLRNLPYASLATQHGVIYPPGNIADTETDVRDNYTFTVSTEIVYIDDPYDGNAAGTIVGKPKDLYPYDYKEADVKVTLTSSGQVVASLASFIAGATAETATNTGILSISVINASGQPVPNATVTITNPYESPAVNITTTTDNNGLVMIPKLPPDSSNQYQVIATLGGYSTDGTIAKPSGSQTAVKLNPNVLSQQITSVTLAIDQLSTLYIHAVDTSGNTISSLAVTTTGAKEIDLNPAVYKYSLATSTNSSGNITLNGMEWDSYSFAVPTGYYIVSASPYQPSPLSPNSAVTENLVVSQNASWPVISSVSPISQDTGTTALSLAITGSNLPSTSTVKLEQSGQSNITATGCVSTGSNPTMKLTCNVNLAAAATGNWNIVVANATGATTQTGGFSVNP
jgi:type II secretory pathway pseudopilin PulG